MVGEGLQEVRLALGGWGAHLPDGRTRGIPRLSRTFSSDPKHPLKSLLRVTAPLPCYSVCSNAPGPGIGWVPLGHPLLLELGVTAWSRAQWPSSWVPRGPEVPRQGLKCSGLDFFLFYAWKFPKRFRLE